jgi:beta-galactosidase
VNGYRFSREPHDEQLQTAFNSSNYRNVDTRVVEIGRRDPRHKLLVVPGVALMDEATANKIRKFRAAVAPR